MPRPAPRGLSLGLLLVLVSLLPNLRAAWPDQSYFLRDFSLTYYPLRDAIVAGLRDGRWSWWNAYLHEGCAFLPMLYPLELLQALWPGPAFASWLLTIHFPIAALGAFALSRDLGTGRLGAFVAGAAWGTCGLATTSLDLHWFLQAYALTPFVAMGLRRAIRLGGREVAFAAAAIAVATSTLAVEFVGQALLAGLVLGLADAPGPAQGRRLGRALHALALGAGAAALPILLVAGILAGSVRGAGLDPALLLQKSLHPLSLFQLVIPDFHGSIREPLRYWWGGRLVPGGSPYFLSLYLGPVALVLAAAGARPLRGVPRALVGLFVLGLLYALGPWGGLAPALADLVPVFRFPVKAMLLPTLAVALLAGRGIERLQRGEGRRSAAASAVALAALVGALLAGVALSGPALAEWLDISPPAEAALRATLRREALECLGLLAALGGLLLIHARRPSGGAAWGAALAGLLVLDLWHAAVGVNRQVAPSFFAPTPGLREGLGELAGSRVFTLGVDHSPFVRARLAARPPGIEESSFALAREVLNPYAALLDRVETAEGADRLSFIPNPSLVAPWESAPDAVGRALPRLRSAAVARLLSLDPLDHPDLALRARVAARTAGAALHVYDLARPWPRAYVACRVVPAADRTAAARAPFAPGYDPAVDVALEAPVATSCSAGRVVSSRTSRPERQEYVVEADGPGVLVVRDSFAPGWKADVDGRAAPLLRANGRHRAVALSGGRHEVRLAYQPPGLVPGLVLSCLAVALIAGRAARP